MSIVRNMELEEIISFYAKRGDVETLCILRHIQEEIKVNPSMNGFESLA